LHKDGTKILAEVKSAPLITYPLLINIKQLETPVNHQKINLTSSQFKACDSALYLHNHDLIPLGKIGSENWPFKPFVDFATDKANETVLEKIYQTWLQAREAYISKNKENSLYYLTNACGNPPVDVKRNHDWPQKQVISDSKTSAGMDRTDDIKKGIYQTLKIGITHKHEADCKTAIISNLPAYRHNEDYILPFVPMLWGIEDDLEEIENKQVIQRKNLRYLFDYIITLENPLLRELVL
jgi:hypothetical protein